MIIFFDCTGGLPHLHGAGIARDAALHVDPSRDEGQDPRAGNLKILGLPKWTL